MSPPQRLPGLDLLRSIAIVWVMLFHTYLIGDLAPGWTWLSRYGWMGVDLFFVLSGFLIGTQVLTPLARGERLRFGDFYLRRALRILPAFWVMLALYLWWPAIREVPRMEPWWKFVFFLFNVTADYRNPAFSQIWSLCVEEHFYLVFPLLAVACAGRLSARGFVRLCLALVAAGMLLRCSVWIHDAAAQARGAMERNWFVEDIYYPTWNRLDGLLAGIMLAAFKVHRPLHWARLQRHADACVLAGLTLLAVALWLFRERTGLSGNVLGWPVLSAALALLVFAAAGRSSVIGRRALPGVGWIAAASYSLYLVHKAVFRLVERTAGDALQGHPLLAFCAYALATLLAGALLHYAVERPCLRLRGRLLRAAPGPRRVPLDRAAG
ncbi:peptidoglycan/LPS O-acetylase OafA/YrhL [Xanthomonas arboricola]|uniref:acyltransferase family protein n=1 Tax=Xanthomonas TaxID=338 RepID=UPI0018447ECC|nr:acyltransferase [Xanthomonas arboricola]MBB5736651.1 peptidoglycan/LPS O-acetylase OafA/YrhL [Xanthomonas sp. CFBP 8152]